MKFNIGKIPQKITPCPIKEAVVELRFDTSLPYDAVPGMILSAFKDTFGPLQRHAILEIPEIIRTSDPNLEYSPYHLFRKGNFVLQVGPKCFSIACVDDYTDWNTYFSTIKTALDGLLKLKIVEKPTRLGLRYVSFFNSQDIFANIQLPLEMAGNSLIGHKNVMMSEFEQDGFKCVLQLRNQHLELSTGMVGSVVDIDLLQDINSPIDNVDLYGPINKAHDIEKLIFFGILKPEYLNTLKPQYE